MASKHNGGGEGGGFRPKELLGMRLAAYLGVATGAGLALGHAGHEKSNERPPAISVAADASIASNIPDGSAQQPKGILYKPVAGPMPETVKKIPLSRSFVEILRGSESATERMKELWYQLQGAEIVQQPKPGRHTLADTVEWEVLEKQHGKNSLAKMLELYDKASAKDKVELKAQLLEYARHLRIENFRYEAATRIERHLGVKI